MYLRPTLRVWTQHYRSPKNPHSQVGSHWFQWVDQPNTGRSPEGENYNIGLVDITDRPHSELIKGMKATHKHLHKIHSGQQEPVSQKPAVH